MNILYLGDVMGEAGMQVVEKLLPGLRKKHAIDVVIAQSENVSDGKGMLPEDMTRLLAAGVDVFSGGNHSLDRDELLPLLRDPNSPVIAPANMQDNTGKGMYRHMADGGEVVVISLLSTIFVRKPPLIDNPLQAIDAILASIKNQPAVIAVNIHGDYSSDKRAVGLYLDGKVSMVVGDHWHVPTADAQILPAGTAHITDVGMCGTQNSVLGVKTENILKRMRDDVRNRNELETVGPLQLCGLLVAVDPKTARATEVQQILETVSA